MWLTARSRRMSIIKERILSDLPIQEPSKLRVIVGRNDTKCTYTSTKTHYVEQEFFRCESCFKGKQNCGVCAPCARTCHDNHRVYSIGTSSCFCDCGLQNCAIRCKAGEKCSYDAFGKVPTVQKWYECHTCWGGESSLGCCEDCANDCHSGHKLAPHAPSSFFCDCGHNKHNPNVCTYHSTGSNFHKQPFYFCHKCFTNPITEGCCYQCTKHCHDGHRISFKGIISAYCDCGLTVCAINCKIPCK